MMGTWQEAKVAMLILHKLDFKTKLEEAKKVTTYWLREQFN